MNFITTLLGIPLGWIMYAFYFVTRNYVLSLLLFTLATRLIMIPMTIKSQKSNVRMQMIKPELEELQKKYAKNKEKLNEEMMKLYQRAGYNPMSGCLPLLIQFPILFGLIDVIYKPLKHVLRLSDMTIQRGMNVLGEVTSRSEQLDLIKAVKENSEPYVTAMGQEAVDKIQSLNLNYWGLDLTATPSTSMFGQIFSDFNPVLLIPILAGLTSLALSLISTRTNTAGAEAGGAAAGSMKGMMLMMPVFSVMFTFSVPAGVGIYWTFSNIIGIAQSLVMNKFFNVKEAVEKARLESEERKEREREERREARKKDPNAGLSQKELNRRKIAEARRRDAEKYGEEYKEMTDEEFD